MISAGDGKRIGGFKMIKKGTMRPLKKILGGILVVISAGLIFASSQTMVYLTDYRMLAGIAIGLSGYFHLISGRQL